MEKPEAFDVIVVGTDRALWGRVEGLRRVFDSGAIAIPTSIKG